MKVKPRWIALGFFLVTPLPCLLSFGFMDRHNEAIYYALCGLAAMLGLFGLAALTAKPRSGPMPRRGLLGPIVGGLIGLRIGVKLAATAGRYGVVVAIAMGAAAGALLLFYDWICASITPADETTPPP